MKDREMLKVMVSVHLSELCEEVIHNTGLYLSGEKESDEVTDIITALIEDRTDRFMRLIEWGYSDGV